MKTPLVAKLLLVALCVLLSATGLLDRIAERDQGALWQRALVTFALARTLNGVISVAQGTEIALQPAGMGVTLTPGEILDPVNDLVERFSWLMLSATISIGVQEFLLQVGQTWTVRVVLLCLAALWVVVALWGVRSHRQGSRAERVLFGLLLCVFIVRIAIPAGLIASERIYDALLASQFVQSSATVEQAGEEILSAMPGAASEPDAAADGESESWSEWLLRGRELLDIRSKVEAVRQQAAEAVEHLIRLSVVFVLQTIVFPLLLIWLAARGVGWIARALFV